MTKKVNSFVGEEFNSATKKVDVSKAIDSSKVAPPAFLMLDEDWVNMSTTILKKKFEDIEFVLSEEVRLYSKDNKSMYINFDDLNVCLVVDDLIEDIKHFHSYSELYYWIKDTLSIDYIMAIFESEVIV